MTIQQLTLIRTATSSSCTTGQLLADGIHLCDTLEPPLVGSHPAIPPGSYTLDLTLSPRFRRLLPLVRDVPGRSGIRIHRGNTPSDTLGCILPGRLIPPDRIAASTDAELLITRLLLAQPSRSASLTIRHNFNTLS